VSTSAATPGRHSCALAAGAVKCWGFYDNDGDEDPQYNTPVAITGLAAGVASLATGDTRDCVVADDVVKCWGDFLTAPVALTGTPTGIQAIAVHPEHGCLLSNGRMMCWGLDKEGRLGSNAVGESHVLVDVVLP
jgi:hypothetical protein